jgi:hypothetical protein
VVGLHGADARILFEDERLEHIRRLMDAGCYGPMDEADPLLLRTRVAEAFEGEHRQVAEIRPPGMDGADATATADAHLEAAGFLFAKAREAIASTQWACLLVEDAGIDRMQRAFWKHYDERAGGDPASELGRVVPEYYVAVDAGLGSLFETLDAETVVACVSAFGPSGHGLFVLAGPGCPAAGQVAGATAAAVLRALFEAAAVPVPEDLGDATLGVAAAEGTSDEDDEQAIRDRLSGLGYI